MDPGESGSATAPPLTQSENVSVDTESDMVNTNSVTRSYSHLDYPTFMAAAFSLCAARTALQQPLNIALLRKQSVPSFQSRSTRSILSHIYRNEGGVRAVLRGMPALTLGCASSEVVYLGLLEYGRERIPLKTESARTAAAGYGSDAACRLLHIPLSIIAYRQMGYMSVPPDASAATIQTNLLRRPLNSYQTLRLMYRERGLRTVFAGLGTTLMIGSQWSAVWWPLYGWSKAQLYAHLTPVLEERSAQARATAAAVEPCCPSPSDFAPVSSLPSLCSEVKADPPLVRKTTSWMSSRWWTSLPTAFTDPYDNALINTTASALTSASTAIIFNPFLVIRTNLQVQPNASLWFVTKSLYQQRGWRAFYSGLYLSITTCIVDGALATLSYEYARLWSDNTKAFTS